MSVDKNNLFQQSLHDTVSYESQKCHILMGWSVFSQALKLHEVRIAGIIQMPNREL